jgi:hypothetical protein
MTKFLSGCDELPGAISATVPLILAHSSQHLQVKAESTHYPLQMPTRND